MPASFYRVVIVFLSRSVAKVFLFLALSVSTPTVNAMRSLEEDRAAVVIFMNTSDSRKRNRALRRSLGFDPSVQYFVFGDYR
ncbi:MAG: hypothetical protein Q8916_13680 [Bacteroidota bacterium]|nr:hypothetical protein [Bacteroidota bacterium]MDP4231444.1 hypothetical protein [Bacteroidota bacterium]